MLIAGAACTAFVGSQVNTTTPKAIMATARAVKVVLLCLLLGGATSGAVMGSVFLVIVPNPFSSMNIFHSLLNEGKQEKPAYNIFMERA